MNKSSTLGLIVMLMGAMMLLTTSFTYATVGIDTVPPTIVSSTPFDKSAGYVPASFISTGKYSARVTDAGVGVVSVTYTDPETQNFAPPVRSLTRVSGTANDGVWEALFPSGLVVYSYSTDYPFTFVATDGQGNKRTVSGTFRIYSALVGKWYVGTTEVTSPSQTIWLNTNSVKFKFVKTSGVPDSQITCTLSGGVSGSLSLVSAGTWETTKTLADGAYTITMTASDGTNSVVMSIYDFGIGEETVLPDYGEDLGYLLGFGLMGLGLVMYAKGREK